MADVKDDGQARSTIDPAYWSTIDPAYWSTIDPAWYGIDPAGSTIDQAGTSSTIDRAGRSWTIEPPPLKSDDPQLPLNLSSLHLDAGESIPCPLPNLAWVDSSEMWKEMRLKDRPIEVPQLRFVLRHPCLDPVVRADHLAWLMGACDAFRFHRETFYVGVDIFDRFMDKEHDVKYEHVGTIVMACFFIATKLEEIGPPDLQELITISSASCTVSEVQQMEVHICNSLEWSLQDHVTVNTWMNIYMQLTSLKLRPPGFRKAFEYRAFSPERFAAVMKLLDIACLDIQSRQFGSSVLAASAFYLAFERSEINPFKRSEINLNYIGYSLGDIQSCVVWLEPLLSVIIKHEDPAMPILKVFEGVNPADVHNIQVEHVTTEMVHEVFELRRPQLRGDGDSSLTPPREF